MPRRRVRGDVAAPPSSDRWHLLLPEGYRFDNEGKPFEYATATAGCRTVVIRGKTTNLRAGHDTDQDQTQDRSVAAHQDTLHLHVKHDYPQTTPELRTMPTSNRPASAVSYRTVFYPPLKPAALFSVSALLENGGADLKNCRDSDKERSEISPSTLLQAAILVSMVFPPPANSLLMALCELTARWSALSVDGGDLQAYPAAPIANPPNPAAILSPPVVPPPRDRLTERADVHG